MRKTTLDGYLVSSAECFHIRETAAEAERKRQRILIHYKSFRFTCSSDPERGRPEQGCTYKLAHIHLGDFGGDWGVYWGTCKAGQTQNTTVGTAKKTGR